MSPLKHSYLKGLTFGIASGIVTTLGLMVGLYSGTHSRLAVLGGILTIAIADAMSDAFGMHLSEESAESNGKSHIWESMVATFIAKLVIALTFALPVIFMELKSAIIASFIWALFILCVVSIKIASWRKESKTHAILEHWGIATSVVIISYYVGVLIDKFFGNI